MSCQSLKASKMEVRPSRHSWKVEVLDMYSSSFYTYDEASMGVPIPLCCKPETTLVAHAYPNRLHPLILERRCWKWAHCVHLCFL
jgi:hypothetical protein